MTEMKSAKNYMNDITVNIITKTVENQKKLSAPENISCSEHGKEMLYLFGENSRTNQGKLVSTALYSGMKANINHQTLSSRLTPLLISAGLVRGIIPMSMRVKSNQLTLDAVLKRPDGECAEKQKLEN